MLFYVFAGVAILSALAVVGQRNPTYSAFALIVTLCSLSAIFGLLGSPFIAALQVIVYAGAIMVLFLFVIMLLNVRREAHDAAEGRTLGAVALVLAAGLLVQVGVALYRSNLGPAVASLDATTRRMAHVLFSAPYVYAFEATSVLILAALVGAIALAKKDL
jgi:NADH-quinone oxidoreductase subunit J